MNKQPIAILTSDWHLRSSAPLCRTDNYLESMIKKINFVFDYAYDNKNILILHAGDLFHSAKSDNQTIAVFAKILKHFYSVPFYTLTGNHDLLYHSISTINKTAVNVLINSLSNCHILDGVELVFTDISLQGYSYGKQPPDNLETDILVIHDLIDKTEAVKSAKKYPLTKLILVGDNHETFVVKHNDTTVISPGSLMRSTADQINHRPCFFVLYEDLSIEQVFIPIEQNVISRRHIETKERRDKRMEAFVESINSDFEFTSNFERNLRTYFKENNTRQPVQNIVKECVTIE